MAFHGLNGGESVVCFLQHPAVQPVPIGLQDAPHDLPVQMRVIHYQDVEGGLSV
eukprot:CAMPEP_0170079696 /NCGR_PEP_ID=MMETSP0019_2-20121128/16010_1 /TAXON_ID=98059 /ORGANISM="Dinobryon sp., Strain UTEXLB2267" /LENGTH=53 /DNA_ID=CAMNT_0010293277 /DNA_START=17 /DNA_END=175 /DNA_ORIENTATION=+